MLFNPQRRSFFQQCRNSNKRCNVS